MRDCICRDFAFLHFEYFSHTVISIEMTMRVFRVRFGDICCMRERVRGAGGGASGGVKGGWRGSGPRGLKGGWVRAG